MGLIPLYLLNDPGRMLSLVSSRQEAISNNIANMHTTGYRRQDIDFSQYLSNGVSSRIETKVIDKYGSSPVVSGSDGEKKSIEDELGIMQQNYVLYRVAARNLSSTITQIKSALNVSANG